MMSAACPAPPPGAGFVQDLLVSVDCNVRMLTEAGYGALARPDSPVAAALTILLTLYIGFMGFGLITGRSGLRVGEVTVSAMKIGVVLALATSWPTYQQLVFQSLFDGPGQIASSILSATQPAAGDANPFAGLQAAYDSLQAGSAWYSKHSVTFVSPFQGGPAFGALALNSAAMLLLLTSLGAVLTAKIVLGLLLGLGPLFVALLLFDATRGIFEGWLRAVIAVALTPLLTLLSLVVQLVLIAPHIATLGEQQAQGVTDIGPANAILVLVLVGALVTAGLVGAVAIIALGLRLPGRARDLRMEAAAAAHTGQGAVASDAAPAAAVAGRTVATRAAAVAAAAVALERRDYRVLQGASEAPRRMGAGERRDAPAAGTGRAAPLGHAYRRAALPRRAASNVRRDG